MSSRLARRTSRSLTSSPCWLSRSRTKCVASGVECTNVSPSRDQRTSASRATCRASWSALPAATIVPSARIRMRSASRSASSRSCVVSRIVVPSRSESRCTRWWNSRRASGSKPAVGSSRNSSSGRPTIPIATSRRRRWPPESVTIFWSASSARPTISSRSSTGDGPLHLGRRIGGVVAAELAEQAARRPARMVAPRLQHHAGPRPPVLARPRRVLAEHADLARGAHPEALEDLDRGRLPGAVGAEQADHLAAPHLELHALQDVVGAVAHAQIAHGDHRDRSCIVCVLHLA